MDGVIYQVQDGQLIEMHATRYGTEADLQDLLSAHPALLAGEQIDQQTPRRWLLVQAEIAVPDALDAGGRWALDHLFLDQDAVPTFVEVKRSTDTRIRREVIGQMLDYAANATVYWPVDRMRSAFEARCLAQGLEADEQVRDLAPDGDAEAFWTRAAENLSSGRLRLLFVADQIPAELRRVIEFLNAHFDRIEVLGVEVKQYRGGSLQALVPRVVGQTAQAQDRKQAQPARYGEVWDQSRFEAELLRHGQARGVSLLRQLIDFAARHQVATRWGRGAKDGSFQLRPDGGGKSAVIYVWSNGQIGLNPTVLQTYPAFQDDGRLDALRQRFAQLSRTSSGEAQATSLKASDLVLDDGPVEAFLEDLIRAVQGDAGV